MYFNPSDKPAHFWIPVRPDDRRPRALVILVPRESTVDVRWAQFDVEGGKYTNMVSEIADGGEYGTSLCLNQTQHGKTSDTFSTLTV